MFSMTINNDIVVYFTFVLTTVNYKNDLTVFFCKFFNKPS